jgi:predicted ArsR family transcriptional regulator
MDASRTLVILQEADRPLSTNEVAEQLDVDWHTAKKRLDALVKKQQVHRSEVSNRLTLYWDQEIPF